MNMKQNIPEEQVATAQNPIAEARKVMREAFAADPEFRRTYVDNIAILMWDRLGTPHEERNALAEEILDKIFSE